MNIRYSGRLANPPPFEHGAGMKWGTRISCLLGVNQSGNMQKGRESVKRERERARDSNRNREIYKFTTANHSFFAPFPPLECFLLLALAWLDIGRCVLFITDQVGWAGKFISSGVSAPWEPSHSIYCTVSLDLLVLS